jgi:hypothetical protein
MTQQQINNHIQSKRRTIMMLIAVCVVFAICWLPLNIYHIITDYGLVNYSSTTFLICHWIAMSSVCYNPFIYFWLNKHYSETAKYLFKTCLCIKCFKKRKELIQRVDNLNEERNGREINIHRLERSNAFEVSKGKREEILLTGICVSHRNSSSDKDNNIDNNPTVSRFIDESNL